MSPLVTIGIPVYNVAGIVGQTLLSVFAQDYPSLDILLVDDCSTDATLHEIEQLLAGQPRSSQVRLLSQPSNRGVSAARNRIIDEALGDYIYFLDSDDTIEPHTISTLVQHQQRVDADIVFGSYEKVLVYDADRHVDGYRYPRLDLLTPDALAQFAYRCYGGIQASACNYLVRKAILHDSHLRFIDTRFWEDMAFTFDLVTLCRRAVLLPDVLYHYRCRYDSLSHYGERATIPLSEVEANAATIEHLKQTSAALAGKSYLGARLRNIMQTDYYIVRDAWRRRHRLTPRPTVSQLLAMMHHPLTFRQVMQLKTCRLQNLAYYLFSALFARKTFHPTCPGTSNI